MVGFEYCWQSWNYSNSSKPNLTEQVGLHFCLIYAALLLQYIIFCLLLTTILLRCWCNRRKKRKHTKSFTLPDERGGENVMPTSCHQMTANNNENIELGKWRKDDNKRVSDAYSVVRFTESSNMYSSTADSQKNANSPAYSRIRLLGGNMPAPSYPARNNSILLEESIELLPSIPAHPTPPNEKNIPPLPKPRNSMILNTSSHPTQLGSKQETLTINPEIDTSKLPPPNNDDTSSTYSMAGQCNEDGESHQGSDTHYSTISRSSADIYSLASNADKEPADYEDFYSVPRDEIQEAYITHREAQPRSSATTTTLVDNNSKEPAMTRMPPRGRTVKGTRERMLQATSESSRKRSLSANVESMHEPPVAPADFSVCTKNNSFNNRTNKPRHSPYVNV